MPALTFNFHTFKKRVPLTISRGTSTHTTVGWLSWSEDGVEGWGEAVPFAIDEHPQTVEVLTAAVAAHRGWLEQATAWERIEIVRRLRAEGAPSALIAAVNLALYDWLGKRLGQPVWRLFGLPAVDGPLTSVTIGIATPEAAVERVRLWRESGDVRAFKVKLGSKAGAEADRAMFAAVLGVVCSGLWKQPFAGHPNGGGRVGRLILAVLLVIAMYATYSRTGWVFAMIILVVPALFRSRFSTIAAYSTGIVATVLMVLSAPYLLKHKILNEISLTCRVKASELACN